MLVWLSVSPALARSCRPRLIPNGERLGCASCHVNPAGGGRRTPFGDDVRPLVAPGSCVAFWGPELALRDSDRDGRTNGDELGDPTGVWAVGASAPGDPSAVTNPGVADVFAAGDIEVRPSAVAFEDVPLGATGVAAIEIVNVGDAALEIAGVGLVESSGGAFSLVEPVEPATLAPDGVIVARVEFVTLVGGTYEGALRIESHDADEPVVEVSLRATAFDPSATRFERGDASADGEHDVSDAIAVLGVLFTGAPGLSCPKSADANDSGDLDVSDVVFLLLHLFARGVPPNPPFSDCGVDPTADRLACESFAPCA